MTAPALHGAGGLASRSGDPTLTTRVLGEQGHLRRLSLLGGVLLGLAAALLGLAGMALLLGDGRWMQWPRVLPLLPWASGIGALWGALRWRHRRDRVAREMRALAHAIEREHGLRDGALLGALEVGGEGVLGQQAAREVARQLPGDRLAPALSQQLAKALGVAAVGAVCALLVAFGSARRSADGMAAVLHPVAAWRGTLLPALGFANLPAQVPRGMPLVVTVAAEGRRMVQLRVRAEGEPWRDTMLVVAPDGSARLALGAIRAPTRLELSDGRAPMQAAVVQVEERGWIGEVVLEARYPAYLERAAEKLEPGAPLYVPRGTRVLVRATLRGGARAAALVSGGDTVRFSDGTARDGAVPTTAILPIDGESTWRWIAEATPRADGEAPPPELPDPLPFTVMADDAPQVAIVAPATDTTIGTSGVVPMLIEAADDHGVGRLRLELWREAADVLADAPSAGKGRRERIDVASPGSPVFAGGITLPLDGRTLQPGDRLHVVAIAEDNSPWRQETRSAPVVLRVPSLMEQRALSRSLADSLAARAQQLAQQERRLAQNTSDAARNRELAGGSAEERDAAKGAKGDGKSLSFNAAERARQLARDQQQLGSRVDSLRQGAKDLESRLRNANALDTAMANRLKDIQRLLRDAMTPEMQKQLEALNKSSDRLSGTDARQSMQQLAEQQRQMRQQLEKSAEMLKRAALEGAMQTLQDDTKELAKAQREAAQRDPAGRPAGAPSPTDEAKQLADRTRAMERELQSLAKRLEEAGAKQGAQGTREAEKQLRNSQQQLGEKPPQSGNGQPQQGNGQQQQGNGQQQQGSGQQQQGNSQPQQGNGQQPSPKDRMNAAAASTEKAAQQLAKAREAQVNEWKGELSDQLDQSINETMQLARQQAELEQKMRQQGQQGAQGLQGEQSALQQGVQQAAERLEEAGRSSSLLSQRSQKAMAEAQRRVQQATQAMQNGGQPGGKEQAQGAMKDAAEALNQALSSLVRDRERVNGANSASGFTEMMEQLKELSKQQGQLNSQMQGLNLLPGGAKGQQGQQQARVLARQQRDVSRALTDVADLDQTGRMDALAKEAGTIAQTIERQGLDPTVAARQQQLYRRLLDAGKFLEQDERDDQGPREATAGNGTGTAGRVDGPQSGKGAVKFAPPAWSELRGLGPDDRRLVIEYFRRLNGTTPP